MNNNPLNRDSLYSDLMEIIFSFLKTADMKETAIEKCNELIEEIKKESQIQNKKSYYYGNYESERKIENLSEMGFLCYACLHDYDKAIDYFKRNYIKKDKEVSLYILLKLLFKLNIKDYWIKEYEIAVKDGICPRENIKKTYKFIKDNAKFPDY